MFALLVGTGLAVAALYYVVQPLFKSSAGSSVAHSQPLNASMAEGEPHPALAESSAIDALREIEFDRETGKLSDSDYAVLKERYTTEALAQLRASRDSAADAQDPASDDADLVEAMIQRFRAKPTACESCGPRPESDAVFCSNCGRFLGGNCFKCGAQIKESGARFCSSCGASLAA